MQKSKGRVKGKGDGGARRCAKRETWTGKTTSSTADHTQEKSHQRSRLGNVVKQVSVEFVACS